jgi:hypothetical protein
VDGGSGAAGAETPGEAGAAILGAGGTGGGAGAAICGAEGCGADTEAGGETATAARELHHEGGLPGANLVTGGNQRFADLRVVQKSAVAAAFVDHATAAGSVFDGKVQPGHEVVAERHIRFFRAPETAHFTEGQRDTLAGNGSGNGFEHDFHAIGLRPCVRLRPQRSRNSYLINFGLRSCGWRRTGNRAGGNIRLTAR